MAIYLDDIQRAEIARASRAWLWRTELPTWLLIAAVYAAWFGTALNAARLGLPLTAALLTVATTWYMSLQHELLHGHPTRLPWLNALFGAAPLAVWFPYGLYRREHLIHHAADHLTHPGADPESYFLLPGDWQASGPALRMLLRWRNTMAGRVLLGPAFAIAQTMAAAWRQVRSGDLRDVPIWLAHLLALAALLAWLDRACGIAPWLMLAGVAYPALSLSAVRSFQEHRPHALPARRSVINEAAWPWRLLFLNNNYHLVHHDLPAVPWFALGGIYRTRAPGYRRRSGGFVVKGYGEWLARFALRPAAPVVHPLFRDARRHAAAVAATGTRAGNDARARLTG
ncbi:fatty acid desaturase [Cupriavidus sp. 2TAF22]|uniref:fatty acid desaturase n=1 Tax=unclassified Cupriavidus TaxID=2640874 RepID=UPI003F90870B